MHKKTMKTNVCATHTMPCVGSAAGLLRLGMLVVLFIIKRSAFIFSLLQHHVVMY